MPQNDPYSYERESQPYTFIHITKNGGSAIELYFFRNYKDYIFGTTHKWTATKDNNPIVIVREPYERFISMYNYWKNGSHGRNSRPQDFNDKYGNHTIKDFIQMIKDNKSQELVIGFMWREHYKPQVAWFPQETYENAIVLIFVEDLNEKVQNLIDYLGIPNKNIPLERYNITRKKEGEVVVLDEEDKAFIREKYKDDFVIWDNVLNHPEMFKKVL
jgi:hypothetical protein